jgi:ABC-type sugar transport system ATPase subunit
MTDNSGLVVTDISKTYGATRALSNVSLRVRPGEVVALIGHNGAGKSTLLRSLSGAEVLDKGTITVDGDASAFSSPKDASDAGLACVYQELSLIDQLTVAENVFLGRERQHGLLLSRKEMQRVTDDLCREYGIAARANDPLGNLPVAQRQLLEVARAIYHDAKYLLLDEPTTALEEQQVQDLLAIIRRLASEKRVGVLLVDHKLDEVFAVAHRIVGLSNGRIVLDGDVNEIDRQAVVDAIVGDHEVEVSEIVGDGAHPRRVKTASEDELQHTFGARVLEAHDIRGNGLDGVNVTVHEGEILGIYGLIGSGRSRFLRTIYGAEPLAQGELRLSGHSYVPRRPGHAVREGVAFLSEERKSDGFIPQMSSIDNAVLPILGRHVTAGLLDWKKLRGAANDVLLSQMTIRGDINAPITALSGGNQQKALFARATLQAPRLLLLDEPTKGVDIGAKQEIYGIIRSLAREKNVAIIVVSSEEEELTALANTISVFRKGSCDGTVFAKNAVSPAQLRELAWGDPTELRA